MDHSYYIKKDDIVLKPLERNDLEDLRSWRNDRNLSKFFQPITYITSEQENAWYDNYLKNNEDYIFIINSILYPKINIGIVSIYDIHKNIAEIGRIQIGNREFLHKGIAMKSLIMVTDFAFNKLNLISIYARINKDNIPSLINFNKIGYVIHDVIKSKSCYGGEEYMMSITPNRFYALNKKEV